MAITRHSIMMCLIVLVIVMILMNLYTLLIFWKLKLDQRLTDLRNNENTFHGGSKLRNRMHEGGVSSVRFRVVEPTEGRFQLLLPPDLFMEAEYFESLKDSIWANIQRQRDADARMDSNNRENLESFSNRLRRALGGNSLAAGVEIVDGQPNPTHFWRQLDDWPDSSKLISQGSFGQVLSFLSHVRVLQATGTRRGTQLKLELLLEGGRLAFFKPARYPRDVILRGDPYGGKDRHFGEVAAFYLAQLLGFFSGPVVVGRKINLAKEILPYSTSQLNSTFFKNSDGNLCFYGTCHSCKMEEPACADQNIIEGALVVLMDQKLKLFPNPWRRTYKKNQHAVWERNMSFCDNVLDQVKTRQQLELLLDVVAISVFDFLIGNGDRHHLDLFTRAEAVSGHVRNIALLDNGKSFGDAGEDYIDILAPLYQCCLIRQELVSVLKNFRGSLGATLDSITVFDPIYPLLTPSHLTALDRRLNIVISTIEVCQQRPKVIL